MKQSQLNKMEIDPWTCLHMFQSIFIQNGNTSLDMFRHVYSNDCNSWTKTWYTIDVF